MRRPDLIIDGMLSGTGVRDRVEGGYLKPGELGLSSSLCARISDWVERYEDAHFHQFEDGAVNEALDREGLDIARALRSELPDAEVSYYSNARLQALALD